MVTRIRKIVFTLNESDHTKGTYQYYLYDPATQETNYEVFTDNTIAAHSEPVEVGDLLVAEYADIDLPTT